MRAVFVSPLSCPSEATLHVITAPAMCVEGGEHGLARGISVVCVFCLFRRCHVMRSACLTVSAFSGVEGAGYVEWLSSTPQRVWPQTSARPCVGAVAGGLAGGGASVVCSVLSDMPYVGRPVAVAMHLHARSRALLCWVCVGVQLADVSALVIARLSRERVSLAADREVRLWAINLVSLVTMRRAWCGSVLLRGLSQVAVFA